MESKKKNIYSSEQIKEKLENYQYIKNQEIETYLVKDNSKINYSEIAHLYLHLSVEVYNLLKSEKIYRRKKKFLGKSISKLAKSFDEILEVLSIISDKLPDNKTDRKQNKETIFQNKNLLFNSLNHYFTIMQITENKWFNILTIIIAGFSLGISIFLLILTFPQFFIPNPE